ncbi:MAG: hypothetical protein JSS04_10090 [Proteobacteria bacterium]|nr:hypothetical protein [Pseudomonadota bacterium]
MKPICMTFSSLEASAWCAATRARLAPLTFIDRRRRRPVGRIERDGREDGESDLLLVGCLYRPDELFAQLIGWRVRVAVTVFRRRRDWIGVNHRPHAGHRERPSAGSHPLARSSKMFLSLHAQSCRAANVA